MELKMSEILTVVSYIGVNNGYLGNFSYSSHAEFYPLYCDLEINPYDYEGTTREKFIKILLNANTNDQVKILRGVIEKYPIEYFEDLDYEEKELKQKRRLFDRINVYIQRLEKSGFIDVPKLHITANFVEEALKQAETLLKEHDSYSALDRMHTALHAFLLHICKDEKIIFESSEPKIQDVFSKLRKEHPAFKNNQPYVTPVNQMLTSIGKLLENLNEIRNNRSMAHPNEEFLPEEEAQFVINSARIILKYIDSKVKTKIEFRDSKKIEV
ncbi:abortive infection family protein [Halalkalibacterium halodurans]|uniref:abortive infection family protein n=1 Tax=Halalkalibacterium halodurans TaxID=86665 RepID=UPI0010FF0AA9|nr:abortive infection family protein [Halalkalibacterium halodurans]